MNIDLWVIFITGLTTGGLTCLAVQGGLLATALAKLSPVTVAQHKVVGKRAKAKQRQLTGVQMSQTALPVAVFLGAKLLAHTVLGFLLGALGSMAQLAPTTQAIMQIIAGVFMIGTALNMLNLHPIFRYFALQPPKFVTRLVRKQSKSSDVFAPGILGVLTVLIPCGTTQAMAILAVSTGSALWGAAIMFAFVLGTSPTFFVLGFLATQVRGKLQPTFVMLTALLVLFLGALSVDTALSLMGSPLAPRNLIAAMIGGPAPVQAEIVGGVQEVRINALDDGYAPPNWTAQSGQALRVRLVTHDTLSCTRIFTIPSLGIMRELPLTGEVVIDVPALPPGDLYFSCGMGMYTGVIRISDASATSS
ncbi:MAG: sulfite exporter TauE/SafE family protein [Chloroflexi bacterium]|nr:sulfite exporter TauE/SafE family protein [Chloroflexota bacterium]